MYVFVRFGCIGFVIARGMLGKMQDISEIPGEILCIEMRRGVPVELCRRPSWTWAVVTGFSGLSRLAFTCRSFRAVVARDSSGAEESAYSTMGGRHCCDIDTCVTH